MRLTRADVDRYGPVHDCRPPCEDDITVIAGSNEAGKTLYLEALLQLLDPSTASSMTPGKRIDQRPTGQVSIEYSGSQYDCSGSGESITDFTPLEPAHLESIFVVRDNDLDLPDDRDYYASLTEKLGDIHTTEIAAIKDELKDRGRLTDTRLNISSNQQYNDARTVRDDAEELADEISEYVDVVERKNIDDLQAKRLRYKRELREAKVEKEALDEAKTVAEHDRLQDELHTYEETSATLAEVDSFDSDSADQLQQLRRKIDENEDEVARLEQKAESQQQTVKKREDALADAEQNESRLEGRESPVDDSETALETYRNSEDEAAGAERRLSLTKTSTIVAVAAAGLTGAASAVVGLTIGLGLAALMLIGAAISALAYRQANQRLSNVETAAENVVRTAQDAGLEVKTVDDVGPAIETFREDFDAASDAVVRAEERHEQAKNELQRLINRRDELTETIAENRESLREQLRAAGVNTVGAYRERVEQKAEIRPKRSAAERSLIEEFGEPDTEDTASRIEHFQSDLNALVTDVDTSSVDANDYDEQRHQEVSERVRELTHEIEQINETLENHDRQLDEFHDRAVSLTTDPFIGEALQLSSRTKTGLESLAAALETVVDKIENDAEHSRKALEIFKTIENKEEQKLETLFQPDGTASRLFSQITDGEYEQVRYDAGRHEIVADHTDDRSFTPRELSQGTRDQLYFASRVSLAEQLLGNEPGFLLLDDPFMGADPDRLRRGFDTLEVLGEAGWQIFYFTAKQEVTETMTDEYDLPCLEMAEKTLQA